MSLLSLVTVILYETSLSPSTLVTLSSTSLAPSDKLSPPINSYLASGSFKTTLAILEISLTSLGTDTI